RQKKKTPRVRFFFSTRCVEIYSTNENGAFAHVSGASEVTVKHNLGALKHKTALLSTHTSEEDRRQVAMCLGCGTYANQLQSPSTWDSATGLVQIWFDGKLSIRKYMISGLYNYHGGGFNINQSFVGMMSDVHMWNHTLSPCKIQNYMNKRSFTPGNVPNWKALNFQINGRLPCAPSLYQTNKPN
uniref:Pentraxin (PTX) domain-containing protein n=1 Tax=Oryzias latipes TaxID=8090 RepID=A0A3P9KVL2_ORYLA